MWKTVSARIRGAKAELEDMGEDTEGMVESTSKLRDLVKGFTGFDIMEDEKTFKSIYDIILGIGEKWNELNDIDRAALLEALAGKRAGNALAAALNNIDDLKASYETALNASGSAMREQENYEKSIQFSIDRLKATAQDLAQDFMSSDFIKGAVDFLNTVLELLDKIVEIKSLIEDCKLIALTHLFICHSSSLQITGEFFRCSIILFDFSLLQHRCASCRLPRSEGCPPLLTGMI